MAQRQDELGENMRLPWGLPGEPYLTFETQLTKLSKVLSILLTRALHQWWETHGSSLMTRLPTSLDLAAPQEGSQLQSLEVRPILVLIHVSVFINRYVALSSPLTSLGQFLHS